MKNNKKSKEKTNKIRNKKLLKIITAIIILIILALLIIVTIDNSKRLTKVEKGETTTYVLKSTFLHKMKKNDVEITTLKIEQKGELLYLTTTLKNRTNKAIHGFDIAIEVYNSKDERITVLNYNNEDTIQPKGSMVLTGSADYSNDIKSLSYAKIDFFEKK